MRIPHCQHGTLGAIVFGQRNQKGYVGQIPRLDAQSVKDSRRARSDVYRGGDSWLVRGSP